MCLALCCARPRARLARQQARFKRLSTPIPMTCPDNDTAEAKRAPPLPIFSLSLTHLSLSKPKQTAVRRRAVTHFGALLHEAKRP